VNMTCRRIAPTPGPDAALGAATAAFGTETGKGLTCERGSERAPARQPDEVKAAVLCTGSRVPLRYRYSGAPSCQAAARMAVSPKECANACLGFGDCCRACRTTGAIRVEGGLARVDSSRCNGCGECLGSCPLDLIGLIRVERGLLVLCKGPEGPTSEWSCPDGCTLCGRCIDACQEGAFRRTGSGFPEWLAERCNGCGLCVEACPQGVVLLCGANDQAASFAFAGRGTSSRQ